ncbi:MAG: cell division protein FtsA [Maricaulaceae bacterium]
MFSIFGPPSDERDIRAVLDIGTSKAVCLIGCKEPGLGVRILGSGQAPIDGVKAGAVIDLERAEQGISNAVRRAERMSGVAVRSVSVNVSSRSLSSHQMEVETAFASGAVAERNLRRLKQESLAKQAGPETVILHAIPLDWKVDEERGIKDPMGMYGSKLSVHMHFVKADIGPLRNLAHCIERSHVQIGAAHAAPLAAAEAVLTDDEKDLGATVIDLGAGVTSYAIYRRNQLLHLGAIGRGGNNITQDLAIGLSTPLEAAERIKRIYGSALFGLDDNQLIPCPPIGAQDQLAHHLKAFVAEIVRAQLELILSKIMAQIEESGFEAYMGRKIVLTGGGALLTGVAEFATGTFNMPVRIGRAHSVLGLEEIQSEPDFAVASGLMKLDFLDRDEAIVGPPDLSGRQFRTRRYAGGGLGQFWQWLRDNF